MTNHHHDAIERQGVLLNTAMLVGHGTLRHAVMGKHGVLPARVDMFGPGGTA